jgi:hypothetical protein
MQGVRQFVAKRASCRIGNLEIPFFIKESKNRHLPDVSRVLQ